ncbi:hypothetical protein FOZ60_009057 [Perkinsus olseni]|uniref:Uncharacterized protein n=1 Tax=Perkinsus olseni TaxID=32597 RepID=A0A7J6NJ40_PEROL|nr:hypothetical protein FOZ60_009057 [Perkinsus olseni]
MRTALSIAAPLAFLGILNSRQCCNPSLSRRTRYDGADELYEYVEHTGTLHLHRKTVKVTFGLVVRHVGADLPETILGLSFGRPGILKTLLQQLKDSNVIGALSFSVLARDGKTGDFGKVILGDSGKEVRRFGPSPPHALSWGETSPCSHRVHEARWRALPFEDLLIFGL